ncbi:YdeI/OmpD-associated family protein [Gordonia sp. VNQ95]|uniref:YdeI/OmpD-associated family protein n=1 Tax=Gordonia sp. VNQ95 TaxID=3156619 RepID=UPI0032B4327F
MGEKLSITTVLEPTGPAAAVMLTDEQVAVLGGGKTPPVSITVGGVTVAGRVGRMGGQNVVGFSKAVRARLGVEPGDTIDVEIALDSAPREVEIPPALADALAADPTIKASFDALSFTKRKEFARSVAEAKKDETRDRRLASIVAALQKD